jgi:hypothetical protein
MLAAALLLVVLAGCGGGSDPEPTPSPKSPTTTAPTVAPKPTVAPPKGTPTPEALSNFRCDRDTKDVWNASGTLANSGKAAVSFQVTVHVGEETGGDAEARTSRIPSVAPGGSTPFVIKDVPGPKTDDAPCHVQVLARR